MRWDGILIIDKPEGVTSTDVVRAVKRRLTSKTGHLGTLDPFASGVLPVCVGDGTKIAQFLNVADKEYTGIIGLGEETDTGDPTGRVTITAPVPPITAEQLAETARQFHGELLQTPPMYSALKHHGVRLYTLARQGIEIDRHPRRVQVARLELHHESAVRIAFSVSCSKGTYVRVLAQQIGVALGTVAHLQVLRRTRFGPFHLQQAIGLDALDGTELPVLRLPQALPQLREIRIDAAVAERARQGYEPVLGTIASPGREETVKLVGPDGELAAVVVADRFGRWRFGRVFPARGSA
ncbi:MAG: tRNA pseudouridine synthase [Deltaproteobacteria bacterium]|jgi:tRNA pseudouridine55 synthase|nr:tRNA pseudouridine synthase [Deltaproteobacteria bacterium]